GMNVKICAFPEGEDPDSFARKNSEAELREFLGENSQDFISYKASLLMKEAKSDPVKKAELIRDMVTSISKIPDNIQQEVYLQECARIMDISEDVLFTTLAQLNAKAGKTGPQKKQRSESLEVVKESEKPRPKIDQQYKLERDIIRLLLLYGNRKEEFEDLLLKENEHGELVLEPEKQEGKVFEKIFLDLQEDEVAFTNPGFRTIYEQLIQKLNSDEEFSIKNFVNGIDPEPASEVTDILMEEERYQLHDWDRMDIFVKEKTDSIARLVSETILTLRRYLVSRKIEELKEAVKENSDEDHSSTLQDVMDYLTLNKVLSNKLNRVM
ncbi:MAG: DNA primase, partial [Salegentibacter sp.]